MNVTVLSSRMYAMTFVKSMSILFNFYLIFIIFMLCIRFHGMGIIHTAKKNIKDELVRKKKIEALEKMRQKNVYGQDLSVTQVTKVFYIFIQ